MATGNDEWVELVRKGYEYGKAHGEVLTGYFPELLRTPSFRPSELCEVADMIALALKLTEVGIGDYLDDVDRWVRNMFAEGQLTSPEWVYRVAADLPPSRIHPYQTTERVPERNVGGFAGWPAMNDWYAGDGHGIMHCCTGNGTRAIYYVWQRIVTLDGENLRVNLLLNRASPWADVDSHVPYTGRVDVRIKESVRLSIRIPEWVKPADVRVQVNGADRRVNWDGRYAVAGRMKPGEVATMTFPISERTDSVWVQKEKYTLVRKGNDVVAIDPPGKYGPLYQREHYRADDTRRRRSERFVSTEQIYW